MGYRMIMKLMVKVVWTSSRPVIFFLVFTSFLFPFVCPMVQWRAGGHCKAAPCQATGREEEGGLTGGQARDQQYYDLDTVSGIIKYIKPFILSDIQDQESMNHYHQKDKPCISSVLVSRGGLERCWRPDPHCSSLLQASEGRCHPSRASDWSILPVLASDWSAVPRSAPAPAPVSARCELSNPRTSLVWPSLRDTYWERDTAWHIPRDTRAPGDKLVTNS